MRFWIGGRDMIVVFTSFVVWDLVNSEKEKKEKEVIKTIRKKKGRIYRKNL